MATDLLLARLADRLRTGGAEAVAERIVDELWLAVVDGSLDSGQRLPTARQLAIALNVSPRSIDRAYEELERRGVISSRQGAGTFVSLAPVSDAERARHQQFADLCRRVVTDARELGFAVDDVIDALMDYRTADPDDISPERNS
jgi:GntR family transcriptional regulator